MQCVGYGFVQLTKISAIPCSSYFGTTTIEHVLNSINEFGPILEQTPLGLSATPHGGQMATDGCKLLYRAPGGLCSHFWAG